MNWDAIDWAALERLRAGFLEGSPGRRDYWHSESDLAAYDFTFARRIGWKWDYVLADLRRLGWSPPPGEALDWGCGTGIAGRGLLKHFGPGAISGLALFDRSSRAAAFALARVREEFPTVAVRDDARGTLAGGTLLVSHVLGELTRAEADALAARAAAASAVIWVEPGTHEVSRRLITEIREPLRGSFGIVAPCTHQAPCGLLSPASARHWCHHFAPSPPEAYTDANWARFGRIAGIDLRSLPLSYLVVDRRPVPALRPGTVRIIGRPRVQKAHAMLCVCDAAGVGDKRLAKRAFPDVYRQCKRETLDVLQVMEYEGDGIQALSCT